MVRFFSRILLEVDDDGVDLVEYFLGHEVQFDERLKLSDYNCFLLRDFVTCLEEFFTLYRFMLYDEMFISPHTGRLQKINRDQ